MYQDDFDLFERCGVELQGLACLADEEDREVPVRDSVDVALQHPDLALNHDGRRLLTHFLCALGQEVVAFVGALALVVAENGGDTRSLQASHTPILIQYLLLVGDELDDGLLVDHLLDFRLHTVDLLQGPVDLLVEQVPQLGDLHLSVDLVRLLQ